MSCCSSRAAKFLLMSIPTKRKGITMENTRRRPKGILTGLGKMAPVRVSVPDLNGTRLWPEPPRPAEISPSFFKLGPLRRAPSQRAALDAIPGPRPPAPGSESTLPPSIARLSPSIARFSVSIARLSEQSRCRVPSSGHLSIKFSAPALRRHMAFFHFIIIIFSIIPSEHWTNYIFYLFIAPWGQGFFACFVLCSVPSAWHIVSHQ